MDFQAFRVYQDGKTFSGEWQKCQLDDLPAGDVLVEVSRSSLNYKDALSASGNPGVTKQFPHTPGIDAVGIIKQSEDGRWPVGTEVVVFGYDLGMNTWGGFSQLIRVPGDWLLRKPALASDHQVMAWGTAGFTAAISVEKLIRYGIADGPVLVTGATGGVGSVAVALLSKLGYQVHAVSGKSDQQPWLRQLGVSEFVSREDILASQHKAMAKPVYAGAIDTVGGDYVSAIAPLLMPESAVTTCGMIAGLKQTTSVFPLILRGVAILGVDSVELPQQRKQEILDRSFAEWSLDGLGDLVTEIGRQQLSAMLQKLLSGQSIGRVVLDPSVA